MTKTRKRPRLVGAVIGVVLMGVAIYSIFLVEWRTEVPEEPPLVRPLKTMIIKSPFSAVGRKYPGNVRANEEVNLAFQVAGQLIEFPVKKGQQVAQGELLGRLDPRDFENDLAAKQAALTRAQAEFERIAGLAERGMATEKEKIDSRAARDAAEARANIATKALDDTYLRAPFAGVIAHTFVDNFQNIDAKQPVLSLQEVKSVEIVINVPEERVIRGQEAKGQFRFVATFEYLPDREFEVTLKEFATEADPATQTYAATLVMPAPEDVLILPGMTATVRGYRKEDQGAQDTGYAVPVDAVAIDGQGQYYVWVVQTKADGSGTVQRVDVQVGEMVQDDILVLDGLQQGDGIALAGVHLLQEGQQVRPFLPKGDAAR